MRKEKFLFFLLNRRIAESLNRKSVIQLIYDLTIHRSRSEHTGDSSIILLQTNPH